MEKYHRVSVIPRDLIDCNQLQSLLGHKVKSFYPAFKVGQLTNVLLNSGGIPPIPSPLTPWAWSAAPV